MRYYDINTIIVGRKASLGPKMLAKDRNFNEESKKAIMHSL
jgi:hypothetical protein